MIHSLHSLLTLGKAWENFKVDINLGTKAINCITSHITVCKIRSLLNLEPFNFQAVVMKI